MTDDNLGMCWQQHNLRWGVSSLDCTRLALLYGWLRACDVLTARSAIFKGLSNTVKKKKRTSKETKRNTQQLLWYVLYLVAVELKISVPVPIAFDGRHHTEGSKSTHTEENCHGRIYGFHSSKKIIWTYSLFVFESLFVFFLLCRLPYQRLPITA